MIRAVWRSIAALSLVGVSATLSAAQTTNASPGAPLPPRAAASFDESIEVVGIAPIHGLGIAADKVPASVQSIDSADIARLGALQLGDVLVARLASVHANDPQSSPFQPDIQFRGFVGSPLLGASQGVAVYQDGVRVNEPFGDTMQWNVLLPPNAIASLNLMPGSNPLFGLNALGGALSIQTKDGFNHAGQRADLSVGSFGRVWLDVESAAARGSVSYFASGRLLRESGWRDFSPSRMGQIFANLGWRNGAAANVDVSVTAGRTRLRGNGPLPVQLLQEDRDAVFTHPDVTEIDHVSVAARGQRALAPDIALNAVAFYRPATFSTFNGDDTDYEPCDAGREQLLCRDDAPVIDQTGGAVLAPHEPYDATNNTSRTKTRGYGVTGQITITRPLGVRENHFIAGVGLDTGQASFHSGTELARLTATRGTVGTGLIDADSLVELDTHVTHAGAYLANFLTVTPRLTLSGSARFTRSTLTLEDRLGSALSGKHRFGALNPAAGAAFGVLPNLTVFASYSMSSRVPTPSELGCADPDDPCRLPNSFVSDPPLEQVRAHTLESGVRGREAAARWTASVFRTVNRNDLLFISSGALGSEGYFANVGDTVRAGVEMTAAGRARRLRWAAAYTYLRAAFDTPLVVSSQNHPEAIDGQLDVEPGDRLPSVPRHSAKLDGEWSFGRALAGLSAQLTSAQFLRGDEANLLEPLDGYIVANVRARVALNRRATLVAQISNVFNNQFATFGLLGEADDVLGDDFDDPRFFSPGAPRAAWIGIELALR
jgi:outer membrane receptor protein involved in Fe transport